MLKGFVLFLCLVMVSPSFSEGGRTPLRVKNGIVASAARLASEVGVEALKQGGNAVDAAVATAFALAVVLPGAGNIGGGGFMVIRLSDGSVTSIDFRETAPATAFRDMFLDDSLNVVPGKSWQTSWASGVPGSVAGFGICLLYTSPSPRDATLAALA